jgi:predicted transcriptional regulator
MKTTIYTDGLKGWAERARGRAKAVSAGRRIEPSRGIAFESAAEMVRLLTPARLDLVRAVKRRTLSLQELAKILGRDVSAVRRDVNALMASGMVTSRRAVNPGHGRVRIVSAPAKISISVEI